MKKVKLFEQFIAEKISQDAYQIHVNLSTGQDATQHFIDDNNLDGEKLKKYVIQHKNSAEKYVVRDMINGTQPNPRLLKKFVKESQVTEATTSWSKMMSGVKKSETGPWSIVAIEYNKVVGQSIDIKIRDLIPAKYEALKKEFPRAKFHIEDGTGMVVWNESLNEALAATDGKKLTNRVEITAPIARTLMNNARTGKLKHMSAPDGVTHYWNPKTKEYIGKTKQEGRLNQGTYFFSDALDKEGNLVESYINEAVDATRDELMDLLETKYKIKSVRPSEEFDGQTGGIWIAADNEEIMGGNKIFDYYNKSSKYSNGVLTQLRTTVEKKGWWFEWNDPGTIICWPKN